MGLVNGLLKTICFPNYINLLAESIYLFVSLSLTWGKSVGPRPVKFTIEWHLEHHTCHNEYSELEVSKMQILNECKAMKEKLQSIKIYLLIK